MSLILDALKKAEEERRGGTSHVAHAPLIFPGRSGRASAGRRLGWWVALPTIAIAAAVGIWFGMSRTDMPNLAAASSAAKTATRHVDENPPVTPARPLADERSAEPVYARENISHKAPEKRKPQTRRPQKHEDVPKPQQEPVVVTLRELPPQIQGEIPSFSVGGYLYSGNKADRTVLINKNLLREGDEIAPGLRIDKLLPNGMVLNYKGYRYRTSY